jgi:hypothetical protein
MSIKNSSDIIGNRSRDLSVCSAVPQPTVLPRAPVSILGTLNPTFRVTSHLRFICYILTGEIFKREARSEFIVQL